MTTDLHNKKIFIYKYHEDEDKSNDVFTIIKGLYEEKNIFYGGVKSVYLGIICSINTNPFNKSYETLFGPLYVHTFVGICI